MKYFIDTEFQHGFHKPLFGKNRHFIDLISIGMVAEDGRELYAISNEFDLKSAWKDEWLRENVLRSIYNELLSKEHVARYYHSGLVEPFSYKTLKTLIGWNGKSNKRIAEEIVAFTTGDIAGDKIDGTKRMIIHQSNPEFYAYYADYDWVLFCSLFGKMINLPKGFPMYCNDLKQTLDEKVKSLKSISIDIPERFELIKNKNFFKWDIQDKFELIQGSINYPKASNEHNALSDAKFNRDLYLFLQTL